MYIPAWNLTRVTGENFVAMYMKSLKWFVHSFSIVRIRCTQWHWSSRSNDTHKCCARCAVYMVIALNWAAPVMMTCFNVVAARLVRQSRQTFEVLWCQGLSSPPPTPPLQRPIDQMNRDHLSCADVAVKRKHCCVLAIQWFLESDMLIRFFHWNWPPDSVVGIVIK